MDGTRDQRDFPVIELKYLNCPKSFCSAEIDRSPSHGQTTSAWTDGAHATTVSDSRPFATDFLTLKGIITPC